MKRTVLFLSFLLSCVVGMAGNMDRYTLNPASGSSLTQDELKHVTLSFPDADGVKEGDLYIEVYLNEDVEHGIRETSISLEPGSKLKFEGNDVIMDLSEIAEKYNGDLYFAIKYGLKSESYDYAPVVKWMYHLASTFDGMVATPANGSTVAPGDFNKLTLTFPNITNLQLNEYRMYCSFEIRTVEDDEWLGQGNLKDLATIEGNTLSLDIQQDWKPAKSCKIKVSIDKNALVDAATNTYSAQIDLIYDLATKQFEYTVSPSNAEALPITAFHNLAFTFDGAQKIELPEGDLSAYDAKKVRLVKYRLDGYEDYSFYKAEDVTIEGNVVKIHMHVSALNGGKYTLVADEGAFIIDGNPSQKISMEYELLPFDTKFDVKCEETLDSEGRLNVILPSDLRLEYATTQGYVYLKKTDGLSTGFMVFADFSKENNTAWFTFEKSGGDILPDGEYNFHLKSASIVMFSEDDIMVESRGTDIYFKKDATSGIHDVRIVADGKAYTLDGRPAMPNTKGIVVINGVKMVNK